MSSSKGIPTHPLKESKSRSKNKKTEELIYEGNDQRKKASEEDQRVAVEKIKKYLNKKKSELGALQDYIQKLKEAKAAKTPTNTELLRKCGVDPYLLRTIDELNLENLKLRSRLNHLNSNIKEMKPIKKFSSASGDTNANEEKTMNLPLQDILTRMLIESVQKSYPEVSTSKISISTSQLADYQCNSAWLLAANLKKCKGGKPDPLEIAKRLLENFPQTIILHKMSVAGEGYLNMFLSKDYVSKRLCHLLLKGVVPPRSEKRLKVVVDFSSPNIAKEMHVGHLRSTIIGDSICNLMEYMGHNVLRLNHVGDWGTQFGMLIAHLQDVCPDYLTKPPSMENLQRFYKESKIRFDTDAEFKKRAYDCVVKLQNFDQQHIKAWKLICEASRKEFQKIYDRLDVHLNERGESFYQKHMKSLVAVLEKKGLLKEDEGRKIMWGQNTTIPMTIVKSDGGFTYDTSDLAALKQRVEEEKAEWIVYVADEGQAEHFQTLFSCAELAGFYDPSRVRLDFIGFGVVLGENKKRLKTRSGESVKLIELLDEGLKRSLDKLKEKNRDKELTPEELEEAQKAIAYGCIKYADLSHNRTHSYTFSFDKMLEDKGNTAVYLLYMYTRIASIARKAEVTPEQIQALARRGKIKFEHDKEWKLAKTILQFYDVVQKLTIDLALHKLCEYLYELSTVFSEFYDSCYVIEKNSQGEIERINMDRIVLCETTAIIMKKCFDILGLKTVSRM